MRFGFERPQPYFGYVGDGVSHLYAQLHSMSRYRLPPDPCLLLQREMDGRVGERLMGVNGLAAAVGPD